MTKSIPQSIKDNHYEKLDDMVDILQRLKVDLEIAIKIQNNYVDRFLSSEINPEKSIPSSQHANVIFSFIFLTLFKFIEFYDYKDALNYFIKDKSPKKIRSDLNELGVSTFRNKYIGHIIDDATGKLISSDCYNKFFDEIEKKHKSMFAFFLKLYNYNFIDEMPLIEKLSQIISLLEKEKNIKSSQFSFLKRGE